MDEFDFIEKYLAPLAGPEGLGLKDDAALLKPPQGQDLVLTKDTMVEGVHFPMGHHGGDTAEKLLRVNLSDFAAKGARPIGYLLSLALPKTMDINYMAGFSKGLNDVQDAYDFKLFGGDIVKTDGPMVVTGTLIGCVPEGQMITRSGCQPGDDIWVTGTIGDAYLGLQTALGKPITPKPDGEALWHWEEAYYRPEPRLLLRKVLRKYSSSAADVSDGLIADIEHIAKASGVQITLNIDDAPLSKSTQNWLANQDNSQKSLITLLTSGDDYEVVFSSNPDRSDGIIEAAKQIGIQVTKIGQAQLGEGVTCLGKSGKSIVITKSGYVHFHQRKTRLDGRVSPEG